MDELLNECIVVKELKDLVKQGKTLLDALWNETAEAATTRHMANFIKDATLLKAIRNSINSETKTYRYVLPTQLLAKLVDPSVDCRCLQAGCKYEGSFDARSVCHKVIVPFDRENDFVLGGSAEPYVNNPLRQPEVSIKYRDKQKDKEGWDNLCIVLEAAETQADEIYAKQVFMQVLLEIYKRLADVKVTYPVPKRISIERATSIIEQFIAEQSGGERVQVLSAALFLTIGKRFQLYADVRRANVNVADASSGQVADLECISSTGDIVLAVEVKDRDLTISQIKNKLPNMRAQKVTEILFIAQQGIAKDEKEEVEELVNKEFVSGQNIYVFDLRSFASSILALLGEDGRREFLDYVGHELDFYKAEITHRRAWANLLSEL